jgi:hypothetical protein
MRRRHAVASSTYSAGSDYGHVSTTFYAAVSGGFHFLTLLPPYAAVESRRIAR